MAEQDTARNTSKIRNFFIKKRIDNGKVEVLQKTTEEMVADWPLQFANFRHFRDLLLNSADEVVIVTSSVNTVLLCYISEYRSSFVFAIGY